MDYYSYNSELIESLNILRPPVKRSFNNENTERLLYLNSKLNNTKVLKEFHQKVSRDTQYTGIKRNIESLRSSAYKKGENKVVQQFAALHCTTLISKGKEATKQSTSALVQDKPLIKVTVIPKTAYTQTSSLLRKKKCIQKRIYTTVSSHDRKDVYCLARGEDSERIYGVKTTSSSNSYTTHSKDAGIKLEQFSCLKLVLDSLNMDKKGADKKRKKKGETVPAVAGEAELQEDRKPIFHKCFCPNASRNNNVEPFLTPQKSTVKITGQLGLNENDTYVLRCAATVDDKPVTSNFARMVMPHLSNVVGSPCQTYKIPCHGMCGKTQGKQKDFGIQADLLRDSPHQRDSFLSQESQGTQVNFDVQINTCEPATKSLQNECIQCCYGSGFPKIDIHTNLSDTKESKVLKRNNSPCVIISVFNNQEGCENVKVVTNTKDGEKRVIQGLGVTKQYKTHTSSHSKMNTKRTIREMNVTKPEAVRPKRSLSPQSKNQSKVDIPEPRNQRTDLRATSRQRTPPSPNKDNANFNTLDKPQIRKSREYTRLSPKRGTNKTKDKTTNTDAGLTKKYLVNTYTEKLTRMMANNNKGKQFHATRSDPSKVTINIDGDTEYYNVLLHQGMRCTDLKVRKTLKSPEEIILSDRDDASINSPSLTNLLLASEKSSNESPSEFRPDDENGHLEYTFSKLCVRDSIELSHRREDTPNVHEGKSINICNKPLGPVKHYRGDDCSIQDPMIRDKEIRALLGIDTIRPPNKAVIADHQRDVPVWYFFGQKREKQINNEPPESPCVCCGVERNSDSCISLYKEKPYYSQTEPKLKKSLKVVRDCECRKVMNELNAFTQCECTEERDTTCKCKPVTEKQSSSVGKQTNNLNTGTQYEDLPEPKTSFYQQLILNRNIQVFLQLEQFCKQKPIILSRKQYDRVKKTIERTISHKTSRKGKCICKTSLVSVGDVRKKEKKNPSLVLSNIAQTDDPYCVKKSSKTSNSTIPSKSKHKALPYITKECSRYQRGFEASQVKSNQSVLQKPLAFAESAINSTNANTELKKRGHGSLTPKSGGSTRHDTQVYASISCLKPITFSSTNVEAGSECAPALTDKKSHSIHTIFKGRKRPTTPNLGTSLYSLESEENNKEIETYKRLVMPQQESKQRKPFLRRLMSCLVMRSARASDINISKLPPLKMPSVESSIDSYHISTSLGAMEVSSSIYDTSASFYSNHSIYPVNSKIKRGFFNSVREFLTNRKS